MESAELLEIFDRDLRRQPSLDSPDARIERSDRVLREIQPGWCGVTWSDLDGADADAVIAEQIELLASAGTDWEWKLYSYDRPADLAQRLTAAGFRAEPEETVMVGDLQDLHFEFDVPDDVELVEVRSESQAAQMVAVQDEVFGGDNAAMAAAALAAARENPPAGVALVALAGGEPIGAGRLVMHRGTGFVSMWGGAVLERERRRGVFRALLSHARAVALDGGCRYAQVDAGEQSEPILRRLGFIEICTTTPYIMKASRSPA